MKNKIQFIIPKLFIATVAIGIISLIMGTIFKILLLSTILFSIGALIYSKIKKHSLEKEYSTAFGRPENQYYLSQRSQSIIPVQYANKVNKPTIIPIY